MDRLALVDALTELVAAESATNRNVTARSNITITTSIVVAVTSLSALPTNDGVHIDNELVRQEVRLVIAKVRRLIPVVDLWFKLVITTTHLSNSKSVKAELTQPQELPKLPLSCAFCASLMLALSNVARPPELRPLQIASCFSDVPMCSAVGCKTGG